MSSDVDQQVISAIKEVSDFRGEISADLSLRTELGFDSMSFIRLLIELETNNLIVLEKLEVDIAEIETVGNVIDVVRANQSS